MKNRILLKIADNLNIYIDKQTDNQQLMKQLDGIKDQLLAYVQQIVSNRIHQAIINNTKFFKTVIINNIFVKMEQLNRWIYQNKAKVISKIMPIAFINYSDYENIYSKFNINDKDHETLFHWIVNNIDEDWYINIIIQELNNQKDEILIKFFGHAKDFAKFRDEIGSKVYAIDKREDIISNNKNIVIMNNKIVDLDTYKQNKNKYNIRRVAFGSIVNNILIIYHTNYNINVLKQFIEKHSNYTKVYIFTASNSWIFNSDKEFDQYIRLAYLK